uniref:CCHC-type domain-containing protein n=1 Tax=Meloidogyne hapla TaxID=6305 RepID=A0A1I8C1G6_MELHA
MSSLGGPSTKDSSAAGASAQCNLGNEELNISVVDKMLLMGKVGSSQTRFSDLEKVHADTIRLEEGVNRSLRAVNRKINFNATNLTKLADEVNVGFTTLGSQVDDCVNRLNGFATERTHSKSLSPIRTSPRNKSTPKVNLNDKIFEQPQINLSPEEASANNNSQDEVEDQADDHTLNMLSNEGIPSLEIFSDDNIVALDKWSKKFMERIKVYGARLTEEEKLNRLSIFLDDTPKQIFEELSPVKRTTCEQALKSIREELDSPQRRSLSRQALLICKQQDNETVKEFLTRFRPLALATAVDMSGTHRERYLCDLLLERLLPNIAFCMKLLNFTQTNRGFEQLCMDAREVEIMIPGRNNPLFPTANVNEMQEVNQYVSSQGPLGHLKTLNPINPNRVQPREGWRFNQNRTNERNFQNRPSNQQRSWPRPNQRTTNWNRNPSNDRRWNNRPVCNYCSRVGHFASTCRERLERFNSRQYEGQGSSQSQSNSGQIQNASMLSENSKCPSGK